MEMTDFAILLDRWDGPGSRDLFEDAPAIENNFVDVPFSPAGNEFPNARNPSGVLRE